MYALALVTSSDPALDLNSFVGLGVNAANYILGIVGALTLLMFIYGGFTWILSGGSADKVKKGKDIILGSVIGLLIVFSSYMIINYVVNNVFQATKSDGTPAFTGSAPQSTQQNTTSSQCKKNNGECIKTGTSCIGGNVNGSQGCPSGEVCCEAPL